ncbi:hypothetical protein JAAARDRAFT_119884, partial [Jaapia argillacea MUCL 33604]
NDDGPPGRESPYIYGFYLCLTQILDWDVKVVLPSSQKSWIGAWTFSFPDGIGETSSEARPLKDGEVAEWVLLDGTPATCANIALHNLYHEDIDLLISGPNLGRNTSSAFALSSGTIGAALSSSLSQVRSVAVSYGTVIHPTPTTFHDPAHQLAGRIIHHLWQNWGKDDGGVRNQEVDLYNVNIPMIEGLLTEEGLRICWTTIWRNSYGRLFKAHTPAEGKKLARRGSSAGPDSSTSEPNMDDNLPNREASPADVGRLVFKFSPDMNNLITPPESMLPFGSDGWAMHKGFASVTPLRASFAEPFVEDFEAGLHLEIGNGPRCGCVCCFFCHVRENVFAEFADLTVSLGLVCNCSLLSTY